jgi:hypothetical protein|tara:strand:+ start:276 stop:467 length:192 start_codon:yes stop_codon:yes gene_type:complete
MKWRDKLIEILQKNKLTQEDYDEFVRIGKTLKTDNELDIYQQIGDGIYQKTRGTNIKVAKDEF